ncbi:SRPBCC family protein [Mucilaginibacter jinjuensis]|uniref:SRPBCC domain-containing protein n=1 Tax=Mucilaginibacter jinjuensis TaxID=1176721 RepID=A0ABY7T6T6_9SPHI|nr:SRPBCC domain-containing protein [Mucilaginibacter jinjuensis]WCT11988.1 SRPBCC domain-containing protein [Mucilaginibacter jinjuensis]
MKNETTITKDLANKKLNVTRQFNASVEKVWKAWTDKTLLDQWWAPKPWKAITKIMDFTDGGLWLYYMAGPNGEKSYCRVDFKTVNLQHGFTYSANFCDEDGNIDESFPTMHWVLEFKSTDTGSKVDVVISFDKDEDLEKIVAIGFEAGFTMGLGNLDELLNQF